MTALLAITVIIAGILTLNDNYNRSGRALCSKTFSTFTGWFITVGACVLALSLALVLFGNLFDNIFGPSDWPPGY